MKPFPKKILSFVFLILIFPHTHSFAIDALVDSELNSKIIALLAAGDQKSAENRLYQILQNSPATDGAVFWSGILARSRFSSSALRPLLDTSLISPNTPEGRASACVIGVDGSQNHRAGLYYYNALLILAAQNPQSIPIHWMAAVMSRTLTNDPRFVLSEETRKRILLCGVREYESVLSLLPPGPAPAPLHHALANLLDDLEAYDQALVHRKAAIALERAPWSLHGVAVTMCRLGLQSEALPLIQEAIGQNPVSAFFHTQADILWLMGRYEDSLGSWAMAHQLDPTNKYYFSQCAMGNRKVGNLLAARTFTSQALKKFPDDRWFQIWDARLAVMSNEPGADKRLLEAGQLDCKDNPTAMTASEDPWFRAAQLGDLQKIRELLASVDINTQEKKSYNQTALMKAVATGWEPVVVELIRAGADLNIVDSNGDTALHYSADFNQPRMTKLLLDAGAKTDIQDRWKQTPLIMCAASHNWDGFVLLMEKNADVHLATPQGGVPLHYACGHGDLPMIRSLIQHGADVNSDDQRHLDTPLMAACREWAHSYVVRPLIQAGANCNAADDDGRTALHHSIDPLMNKPLVELLIESGANPTLRDKNGTTPITQARLLGFEETAQLMEQKVGHAEPLHFPAFESTDQNLGVEERNAAAYVLPLLLAQGHPLGRPSGVPAGDKNSARKELKRMFGINNTADLKDEIEALQTFQPSERDFAGELPEISASDSLRKTLSNFFKILPDKARAIHRGIAGPNGNESAWIQAHLIYLADLGISAEFLPQDEGTRCIVNASRQIATEFNSWEKFLRSFDIGARFHNGWEADRYANINRLILQAKLSWPSK